MSLATMERVSQAQALVYNFVAAALKEHPLPIRAEGRKVVASDGVLIVSCEDDLAAQDIVEYFTN